MASIASLPKPPWARPLVRPPRLPRTPFMFIMATVFTMALFYVLMSMAPCMVGSNRCYRGYSSQYSFDADKARHPRWMTALPDDLNLTSLSIPGTHDTMTYGMPDDERLQCQIWNLTVQLNAGLRYFDIRARLQDDTLKIYHADGFTGYDYSDVILPMFDFLDQNPGEAIIMRLKDEGPPLGDHNTITFEDALNNYHLELSGRASKHIYSPYSPSAPLPNLGSLRARILLLQNFQSRYPDQHPYGLAWEGPQMILEDLWVIPDVYHLDEKWSAIRSALEDAAVSSSPYNNSALYLSHVSASVGVLPIQAAAGPSNRSVEGMNDLTGKWLRDFAEEERTRTGVIILDFPGKRLIDAILKWNDHFINS